MEVKIYLHYQPTSKSTVRTVKRMKAVTSVQQLFRMNRGLLQHLNFCRRRNMTSNGNQTTIANGGNNDNTRNGNYSDDNDIPNKIESQEKFYWNLVAGSTFKKDLSNAY